MTPRRPVPFLSLAVLLSMAIAVPVRAQDAEPLPTVTADDYGRWEQLGAATLSRNGQWMAYEISRVSEENELRIRRLSDDSLFVVAYGSSPAFSNDGRWLAYSIGMSQQFW